MLAARPPAPASHRRRPVTEPCGPCPDPVVARAERLIQLHCEMCGSTYPGLAPVDDSKIGVENRRDALLVHLVDSPRCERRTVSVA